MGGVRMCADCRRKKVKCEPPNHKPDRTWMEGGVQEKCIRCEKHGHPCGPPQYASEQSSPQAGNSHASCRMSAATFIPDIQRAAHDLAGQASLSVIPPSELAEDKLELKRKLGKADVRLQTSRILQQRIDLDVENPDYWTLLSLKAANFHEMLSLLGLAIPLADRLDTAGEVDVAENAYTRMVTLYRTIDPNSWYEVRRLLWKLAMMSWRQGCDQRGQEFAWEALQCRNVLLADHSDLDWLRELAKSLSRTASDVSEIVQSTTAIPPPKQLTEPIPLLHRLMESEYASGVSGNIFWTAPLPDPNEHPPPEHPVVGGIGTVLEFLRGVTVSDLLARDHKGRSALHIAAYLGKEAFGFALMIRVNEIPGIKRRIMDSRDHETQTILGTSVCRRRSLTFIESLIENDIGVDPDMAILNPLQSACWFGFLEVADLLLKRGANPHNKTAEGKTALDLAREQGHYNIVQRLSHTPQESPRSSSSDTPI